MIISADTAIQMTAKGRETRANIALANILGDLDMLVVINWIMDNIIVSCNRGIEGTSFKEVDLYAKFPSTIKSNKWYTLIQDLGFTIQSSHSSNRENETYYINWTNLG